MSRGPLTDIYGTESHPVSSYFPALTCRPCSRSEQHGAGVGGVRVRVQNQERPARVHQAQREVRPGLQVQRALVARPQGPAHPALLRPGAVREGAVGPTLPWF